MSSKKQKQQKKNTKTSNAKWYITLATIVAVLIGAFLGLSIYQKEKTAELAEASPYQTSDLDGATIDSLNDPNYQNVILPETLDEKLEQGEDMYVFFFSPLCKFCEQSKEDITTAFNVTNTEVFHYNVLEFEQGLKDYNIPGTPTIVYFKNGKYTSSIVGSKTYEEYIYWIRDTQRVLIADKSN